MKSSNKIVPTILLTFLSIIILQSCFNNKISGNGNVTSKKVSVGNYEDISVYGFMDVHLVKSYDKEITITTDENLLDYIIIENKNGKLSIKTEDKVNIKTKKGVDIYVPFKNIHQVALNGSGDIKSDDEIKTKEFKVSLMGSGDIELKLDSEKVEANVTGSGDVELKGNTKDLIVNVNGSGDFSGFKLKSKYTVVDVKGSGDAEVYSSKSIKARVDGSGDIAYKGNPSEKDIKTSGSGDVTEK